MTKQEKQERIQFLEATQSTTNAIIAQLTISGNRIGSVVPAGNYNLKSRKDIAKMIIALEDAMEGERGNIYTTFVSGITNMTTLGSNQIMSKLTANPKIDETKYLGQLQNQVDKFLKDPKYGNLSSKIWTDVDKVKIIETVVKGIKENKTAFDIGNDIAKEVGSGTVRNNIDRVASTELTRAYNRASYDTFKQVKEDYGDELETYVEVFLSPYHPREDICDDLVGIYEVGDAPIPPHHPYCICGSREIIKPKGKTVDTKDVTEAIREEIEFL
jgi:hypothetical protein